MNFFLVLVAFLVAAVATSQSDNNLLPQSRIVGGSDVTIEEYPWQVSIIAKDKHICGATIISNNRVLTGAHCTDGREAKSLSVRVGSTNRETGGKVMSVLNIFQHKWYDDELYEYDIAILEIDDLDFSSNISPANLPSSGDTWPVGTDITMSGWGKTSEGERETFPINLKAVTVQLMSFQTCKEKYEGFQITPSMFCAGVSSGGKGSCQGDSGGPAVIGSTLVGIVSWGMGCGSAKYPGVYANVSFLLPFINDHLK